MRIFLVLLFAQLIAFLPGFAQFDNVWIFGTNAGISFNGTNPVAVSSSINSNEAAAAVCDANGDLLFYTDGSTVWDRFNNPMPNGTNLQPFNGGTSSTSQGAQIVPVPDSAGKYYIFSLTGDPNVLGYTNIGRLYYSIVDMTANGGSGDVVAGRKGVLMATGLCEHMIAVAGAECDFWLLANSQRDSIRAYNINRNGINAPVLSPIMNGLSNYFNGLLGNIDVSDDGSRLAIARGTLSVYDFDINTGLCANMQPLSNAAGTAFYDVAFSPDNTKLYATQGNGIVGLYQYDLALSNTRTQLASVSAYGIKRAPDAKLYVLGYNSNRVHAIEQPDISGVGCQFTQNVLTLTAGATGRSKFSNRTPVIAMPDDTTYSSSTIVPGCTDVSYPVLGALDTNGRDYLWSDGSNGKRLAISGDGIYTVQYLVGCVVNVDSFYVVPLFEESLDLGPDTTICDLAYTLDATYPGATGYLWSNGHRDARLTLTETGSYRVSVEGFRCPLRDTINVRFVPPVDVDLGPDTIICEQTPARIGKEITAADSYHWNTGATTPYIEVSESGDYRMSIFVSGCEFSDTLAVIAMDEPDVDLGADGKICKDDRIILNAFSGAGASYRWSNGDTQSAILVTEAGAYSVRVLSAYGCVAQDTVRYVFVPDPIIHLGPDTVVCEETPLILHANAIAADSIIWSDGTAGPAISIRYENVYTATAYNYCGIASDTIEVGQIFCDIWVPNAFTPNGDGRNDVFRVLGNIGKLEGFGLSIYNRWGERVFHTEDKYAGWDGYYKNVPAPLGTYVYMLEYSIGSKPYNQSGNFHLLR